MGQNAMFQNKPADFLTCYGLKSALSATFLWNNLVAILYFSELQRAFRVHARQGAPQPMRLSGTAILDKPVCGRQAARHDAGPQSGAYGMVPRATVSVRLMLTLQFAPMPPAKPSQLTNLKPIFGPSRQ
jgi:hypothetical protein